jgi:hypothetical protein
MIERLKPVFSTPVKKEHMKNRHLIIGFIAMFLTSFFITSCLNEDNKIPPNCYDGIWNNNEYLLDCGGPNCPPCDHCIDNIWQPELGETCLDCGGECGECSPCGNCIQDGDEVGIDCGGSCNILCEELCDDGMLNGTEEEIDCGGFCEPCPTCTDLMLNGDEIGIDCGGTECPPCSESNNCTNGIMEGNELWIDCGSAICPACDTVLTWKANGVTHTVNWDDVVFSFTAGTLTISGISLLSGQIAINLEEPLSGWDDGVSIALSEASAPSVIGYTSPDAITYSTAFGAGTGTVQVVHFVLGPDGIARGTFQGTLKTADDSESMSITNGLFMVPLD